MRVIYFSHLTVYQTHLPQQNKNQCNILKDKLLKHKKCIPQRKL